MFNKVDRRLFKKSQEKLLFIANFTNDINKDDNKKEELARYRRLLTGEGRDLINKIVEKLPTINSYMLSNLQSLTRFNLKNDYTYMDNFQLFHLLKLWGFVEEFNLDIEYHSQKQTVFKLEDDKEKIKELRDFYNYLLELESIKNYISDVRQEISDDIAWEESKEEELDMIEDILKDMK